MTAHAKIWLRPFLRRLHPLLLWSLILFAIYGPARWPHAYAALYVLYLSLLAAQAIQIAVGCTASCRSVMDAAGTDWRARCDQLRASRSSAQLQGRQGNSRRVCDADVDVAFDEVEHLIVVPNYNEDEGTLRATLDHLASHRAAKRAYRVCLAMEAREPQAAAKGARLASRCRGAFLGVEVTLHPADLPGEAQGKSSNVSWATRHASEGLDSSRVVITVVDADARMRSDYFDALAFHFCTATPEERGKMLFIAPLVFDQNLLDSPALVRRADISWSGMVFSFQRPDRNPDLTATWSARFVFRPACSNYSISLAFSRKVGFWDTDETSIAEDFHMYLKCVLSTGGDLLSIPIPVPSSNCNIVGPSYFGTLGNRARQAARHAWGSVDLGYVLERALCDAGRPPMPLRTLLVVLYRLFELNMLPAHGFVLSFASLFVASSDPLVVVSRKIGAACLATVYLASHAFVLVYEWYLDWHLRSAKLERRSWAQVLDVALLPPVVLLFSVLPHLYVQTLQLFVSRCSYYVSPKPSTSAVGAQRAHEGGAGRDR